LALLSVLTFAVGCIEEPPGPPDAGSDAGTDAGTDDGGFVTGTLTVAPLFGAQSGEGSAIPGAQSGQSVVQLGAPAGPVASGAGAQALGPAARPSRETVSRLMHGLPSPAVLPVATAPKGEQVIPGEFLIVPAQPKAAQVGGGSHLSAALPLHRVRELPGPSARIRHLRVTHADGRALSVAQTLELQSRLAADPSVKSVEPNRRVYRAAVPNDPHYGLQWHYPAIKLPRAWDIRTSASGVVVAVIDSGILHHPDLTAALLPGADTISDAASAGDGDGRDMDPTDEGGDQPGGGSSWHGTHVAGTIGAAGNNGRGGSGVAWNTRILPVRALGVKGGTTADIVAAVEWAIGEPVSGLTTNAHPAQVINMSLGGDGRPSAALQSVIDRAVQQGVIFSVAAGNENEDTADKFPCNQQNVICVGATRLSPTRASYSNFGAQVDVMAPGGEASEDLNNDRYPDGVLSTSRGTDSAGEAVWAYTFQQGTSMAAPHVAGLLALMKAARADAGLPTLDSDLAESILRTTAYGGARCSEGCGAGLIDAWKALLLATGQEVPVGPGELWVSTSSLQLTGTEVGRLLLSNVGGTALTVQASFSATDGAVVEFPEGTSVSLAPGASKSLALRAGASLADGQYGGTVVLTPTIGATRSVDVRIQVGAAQGDGLPVLLVFAYQDEEGEWQAGAGGLVGPDSRGAYRYRAPVPAGEYIVMGSVDDDEDGEYAEDGERLGMYPTLEAPSFVTVTRGQTVSDIDFTLTAQLAVESPTGDRVVGERCSSGADCGAGYVCNTGIPGGYCTRSCESEACPSQSACYRFGSGESSSRYCMATCTPPGGGQGTCRAGVLCHQDASGGGYCHANCNDMAATFCGTGQCSGSGYCR